MARYFDGAVLLRFSRNWAGACILLSAPTLGLAQEAVSPEGSFLEQIQPIVFKNCNGCHTFGGHAGGLTLDTYASFTKGGGRGKAFVPGDPNSLVLRAIRYTDPDLKMPPRGRIPDADIATMERWITSLNGGQPTTTISAAPASAPAKSTVAAAPAPSPKPATSAIASNPAPAPAPKPALVAVKATPEQEQFFESKIRPLLTKNCFACHTRGASGGLRLDSAEGVLKGGKDGAVIVPGHPESSLLIHAVQYTAKIQMPPSGRLKDEDIALLEQWVKDGAPWPASATVVSASKITDAERNFWSFRAPVKPPVPTTKSTWAYNDIDRFLLAKYDEKHLKPVGDADKRTLIRRLSFDLTGLPPNPADIQAFLADASPDAYEKLVDRMLSSRPYGERWGRKWLDLVRYADTNGSGGDYPVPQAYRYRDYVIRAFTENKPYDRFIREQIAGDLLPSTNEEEHWENVIATGYLAGTNRYEGKSSFVADAVDNLGSAYLGLTVGCARCHDHKFDPIPTADYYALYGILASTKYAESGTDAVRFQRDFTYRDPKTGEREDYRIFQLQLKPIQDAIEAVLKLPGTYDDLIPQLQARRMHLFEHQPDFGESAYAVTEDTPEDVRIQRYGDPKDLGAQVRRGFLQVLGGGPLPESVKGSGRLELANWIASKDNPLTARVMVNRLWQGHFGRGIVPTPNDFGSRGMAPDNQALLDFLAAEFMEKGWSIRDIQKEILMSHAYRLASTDSPADEEIDPDNAFVWRHSRSRLDAEQIRDSMLWSSFLLDPTPGGPHPFPPMYTWNYEDQNHFSPNMKDYENNHRTVYMMTQRTVKPQYFTLFDGPNTNLSTEQRTSSLTPLQALFFMNGDFAKKAAENLTTKLIAQSSSEKAQVEQAFLRIYGRVPTQAESERTLSFLHAAAGAYSQHGLQPAEAGKEAFADFVKALYASNEFMFVE